MVQKETQSYTSYSVVKVTESIQNMNVCGEHVALACYTDYQHTVSWEKIGRPRVQVKLSSQQQGQSWAESSCLRCGDGPTSS